MAIKLVREFQQKQNIAFTPQLKKSIDLLQLSRVEMIGKINAEMEDNPFLERESLELDAPNSDYESLISNLASDQSLIDYLQEQIRDLKLTKVEIEIAVMIIGSLNETGMLEISVTELEDLLSYKYSFEVINNVLKEIIQRLEPAGVGGQSFKEIIFLQLQRSNLDQQELSLVREILFNPDLNDLDQVRIALREKYSLSIINTAIHAIKNCDLSPGLDFYKTKFIQPDLKMQLASSGLEVTFIQDNFPKVCLDQDLIMLSKDNQSDLSKGMKEKLVNAKWLVKAVSTRNETVHKVGFLMCQKQAKFLCGDTTELFPLSNIELAKELKLSPSTVSRILREKFIQTPKGVLQMRSLLAHSVSKTRSVTPQRLMDEIQHIILNEPKKLSDQAISNLLNLRGFNLARRTIGKYRKMVNIPNSRNR